MANVIKLKKGLDIQLEGVPVKKVSSTAKSDIFAIVPDDFHGLIPKVIVRKGDKVQAGTPLMYDKNIPQIQLTSPVSGEVLDVVRGERRKVLCILVKQDNEQSYVSFGKEDPKQLSAEQIKTSILASGLWPYIKQRPYDVIANPEVSPRDIFVTAFDSAPLAPDFDFVVEGEESTFQTALDALRKLSNGKVYVGLRPDSKLKLSGVETVIFEGAHPAGNVGIQIANIKPVNKGEVVWAINAFDLLFIGRLFQNGIVDMTRKIAVTGSDVKNPSYVIAKPGARLDGIIDSNLKESKHNMRFISGNVLTGTKTVLEGFLGAYHSQVTVIPEGDDVHEFVGWATPGLNKYSVSRTYFSWLIGSKKKYVIDARIRGGVRAMIMSDEYDRVLPMDIIPEALLKSTITFDIDKMENLGIYEVAPEDFALCEFVDTSKIELQQIIRNGLDQLMKEMN